jgi:hypothetical protein
MIDPMLSLAFTVHANCGTYALLLGSGVSRSSGSPTGWEITLDLVRKLAVLHKEEKEEYEADLETWYRNRYNVEPNYSDLLNALGRTPAERRELLARYFEPSEKDVEEGLKVPTAAHRAIAKLMKQGYFRVVLTTNFDTLMEDALKEAGIIPTVVRHSDDIAGIPPISQGGYFVVKLHGHYLDARIRNTPEELGQYEPSQNKLLDQVLDEFGLIVCGWSSETDTALRAALMRCGSRRYMTYWLSRGSLIPAAQELLDRRKAQVINIEGADAFFADLSEKVQSLRDIDQSHPLTAKVAVASEKRFFADPKPQIRLHDLLQRETEKAASLLSDTHFPVQDVDVTVGEIANRLNKYRDRIDVILHLLANGCYWGTSEHLNLWIKCLERIANLHDWRSDIGGLYGLRFYPLLLMHYASGIAALESKQYDTLEKLLIRPRFRASESTWKFIDVVYPYRILGSSSEALRPDAEAGLYLRLDNTNGLIGDHLFRVLRGPTADLVPDEHRYDELFDRFEYIRSLLFAGVRNEPIRQPGQVYRPSPSCRFLSKRAYRPGNGMAKAIEQDIETEGWQEFLKSSSVFRSASDFDAIKEQTDRGLEMARLHGG